jgi:RNAse (barnase) inhibitor barstar
MSGKTPFVYVEDIDIYVEDIENQARSENLVAIVPAGIRSRETLFSILSNALNFPYFGRNWDALHDCLRDFWWTDIFQITVVHRDIPALGTDATRIYLDVLACCVEDWKPGEDHQLRVVFPLSQKVAIFEAILEYHILRLLWYRENAMREIVAYSEKTAEEIIDAVAGDEVSIQKCLNRLLDTGEIIKSRRGVYRRSHFFGKNP